MCFTLKLRAWFVAIGLIISALRASANGDGTNLWNVEFGYWYSDSSPAVAPDGTIYTGSFLGKFFAVNSNGVIQWTFRTQSDIKSSPAVAANGTIYFGSRDRKFYALTPDGKLKWSFATGAWVDSSPALANDGTTYFGSWDKKFYALSADGKKKWEFATGGPIDSSPALAADGTIYFGSHDKKFYALGADGKKKWEFATHGAIVSSPAINADGAIYFTSVDGNFYALNPDGSERWRLHTGGFTPSSPVIDSDGTIYIGVNNTCAAISPEGKLKWHYDMLGWPNTVVDATPAILEDGTIYCAARGGIFAAIQSDGKRKWDLWIGQPMCSSPAVTANGTILFCDNNTKLRAFSGSSILARSPWPMFRGNLRHTGAVELENVR